jgi:hypothetical protein
MPGSGGPAPWHTDATWHQFNSPIRHRLRRNPRAGDGCLPHCESRRCAHRLDSWPSGGHRQRSKPTPVWRQMQGLPGPRSGRQKRADLSSVSKLLNEHAGRQREHVVAADSSTAPRILTSSRIGSKHLLQLGHIYLISTIVRFRSSIAPAAADSAATAAQTSVARLRSNRGDPLVDLATGGAEDAVNGRYRSWGGDSSQVCQDLGSSHRSELIFHLRSSSSTRRGKSTKAQRCYQFVHRIVTRKQNTNK